MASLTSFVGAAGTARCLIAIISTTFIYGYSVHTPGARLAALRKLLDKIKSAKLDADKILRRVPKEHLASDPAFKGLNKRGFLLDTWDSLHGPPSSAGIF